jgi:hypothetical protein
MTTSGITTTEMNRDSLIEAAMRGLGVLSKGQSPDTEDLANGQEALSNIVALFQTMGMPLWSLRTLDIPLVENQDSYTIGVGQTIDEPFPLKIIQAWSEPTSGGGRLPMTSLGIYDFQLLPINNTASGTPSQYTYQPFINYGILRVWPSPNSDAVDNRTLTISYISPFEDFSSASDTPYFPREWNLAVIGALKVILAAEYGIPLNDRGMLKNEADMYLDMALDFGLEEAPITFYPDSSRR